jgi:hypothetical protein
MGVSDSLPVAEFRDRGYNISQNPVLLGGILEAVACIEVAAQSGYLGVRMSAVSSAQPELPSSSNLPTLSPVTAIRTAKLENAGEPVKVAPPTNPKLYSPINGVVGHTFIRLCLWFDLLSSWKKRSYAPPVDGFPNVAASEIETEIVPHAAAS